MTSPGSFVRRAVHYGYRSKRARNVTGAGHPIVPSGWLEHLCTFLRAFLDSTENGGLHSALMRLVCEERSPVHESKYNPIGNPKIGNSNFDVGH